MEFAIAQGFDLGPLEDRVGELALSTVGIVGQRVRAGRVDVVSTRPAIVDPDGTVSLFAGYASLDGSFVHTLLDPRDEVARRVVDEVLSGREPDGGLYAAARIDARGAGRVQIDPLGQYPLYYLRRGRDFVVSNNPHFVDAAVRSAGPGLTRSIVPAIDNIVYGGPLSAATLFEEVRWLLIGQSLRFDERGLEVLDRYGDDLHAAPAGSADELFDELIRTLRRHTASVADAVPDAIAVADVTGGYDTRVVLAVVTSSGLFPDLTGRCLTRYPHPDANAAGAVMEHLGLEPGPYPIAGWGPIQRQATAIAVSAYQHGAARDTNTQLPFAVPDLVNFTGCFGEVAGGTRPGERGTIHGHLDAFLEHRSQVGATSLMTQDAIALVRDRLRSELAGLDEIGIRAEDAGVELYLRSRCKSLYGLLNAHTNLTLLRPDILATPLLLRLRRALPRDETSAHRVAFEVILRARPDVAFLPMEEPWDISIVPEDHRRAWKAMTPVDRSTPKLSRYDGALWEPVLAAGFAPEDPYAGHEPASDLPSRELLAQAPNVVGSQIVLGELVAAAPATHDVWSWVDRQAIEHAVRRDPHELRTVGEVGSLARVAAAMTWMLGKEVRDPVRAVLGMRALCEQQRRRRERKGASRRA